MLIRPNAIWNGAGVAILIRIDCTGQIKTSLGNRAGAAAVSFEMPVALGLILKDRIVIDVIIVCKRVRSFSSSNSGNQIVDRGSPLIEIQRRGTVEQVVIPTAFTTTPPHRP